MNMRPDAQLSKSEQGLADALAPVRRRFIELAEEHILRIEALRQNILAGREATLAARSIGQTAHRIAGVAATLGFVDLGLIAAKVDRQLAETGTAPELRWQRAADDVEALLVALEAVLDEEPLQQG